jgi:carbon-monoxide dehydrogenase medium subunit/xanthine dehydrogenase FAD-binding subunit
VPTVLRFPEVERRLMANRPTDDQIVAAGRVLAEEMIRLSGRRWSTPYKEPVVAALLGRAVTRAIGRASK